MSSIDPPISIRLPQSLINRVEQLASHIPEDSDIALMSGKLTRSKLLRLAVLKGVQALEREYPPMVPQFAEELELHDHSEGEFDVAEAREGEGDT